MKIGIITHYYKSGNYGGTLQAYALCKQLEKMGYEAEQICATFLSGLPMTAQPGGFQRLIHKAKLVLDPCRRLNHLCHPVAALRCRKRKKAVMAFGKTISHSRRVYTDKTLPEANSQYQAFITGSDQVWNPECYSPAYYLAFAEKGKLKLSYGASISKAQLTQPQRETIRGHLADFAGVSVREERAAELIGELAPTTVAWVLDPTLLLSREEWDEVCAPGVIREPYVFCFFLGGDESFRTAAAAFAREKGLKLVTLPYLTGQYRKTDKKFGDIRLYRVSPPEFISLIKNADYVFTDSFHASVFSELYEKNFFAFRRGNAPGMETRLESLTKLFGNEERFRSEEKLSPEALQRLAGQAVKGDQGLFLQMKEKSVAFLREQLQQQGIV